MTISELYERFSRAEEWRRLAVATRSKVVGIVLKPHGHEDADTLTGVHLKTQAVQYSVSNLELLNKPGYGNIDHNLSYPSLVCSSRNALISSRRIPREAFTRNVVFSFSQGLRCSMASCLSVQWYTCSTPAFRAAAAI